MNNYEEKVYQEMMEWELKILRNKSMVQRLSKKAQNKINSYIPEKAHTVITEAIKHMVKATLVGSDLPLQKSLAAYTHWKKRKN